MNHENRQPCRDHPAHPERPVQKPDELRGTSTGSNELGDTVTKSSGVENTGMDSSNHEPPTRAPASTVGIPVGTQRPARTSGGTQAPARTDLRAQVPAQTIGLPLGPVSSPCPAWLEVVHPDVALGHVRHALFDFDGTISVIRRGWEQVMIPLMIEMITGGHPAPPGLAEEVADYVDRSTGILTIKQMAWLAEAVRRYGLAATPKSARAYKRIYNERLLKPVRARVAQLDGSDAARDTLMIAGARDFLATLRARGVRLYLASGTDHAYVLEEAAALGVTDFFEGRIFGAQDREDAMSKADVIAKILADHDLHGSELVVVGDGPVEIRHGRAHGAVTLGVAADEDARAGLNPRKRRRLLDAGADMIVTDFRHAEELVTMLTGGGKLAGNEPSESNTSR